MPAWSYVVPVAGGPKIAFNPAVSWDVLRDDKASLFHSLLQSCRYDGSLNSRTLLDQMGHGITKAFAVSQMLVHILPVQTAYEMGSETCSKRVHRSTLLQGGIFTYGSKFMPLPSPYVQQQVIVQCTCAWQKVLLLLPAAAAFFPQLDAFAPFHRPIQVFQQLASWLQPVVLSALQVRLACLPYLGKPASKTSYRHHILSVLPASVPAAPLIQCVMP